MSVRRRTGDRALRPKHNVFWAQQQVLPTDPRSRHGIPSIPHSVQSLHGEFREESVVVCTKSPLDVAQICGRYVCEDTRPQHSVHLNFTTEPELNSKLPFLDLCIHVKEDVSTKITIYRKPTHTPISTSTSRLTTP